ncbi:unnamed protein product [Strongylus vulgaris]|uniref:Uncharacterized protein n=1 Tax=Strongylus vulgaris TaxID=40348 RepID=A0A3P7JR98_STRVU|nr:unnamed protein product [Strongylus vulgaris]
MREKQPEFPDTPITAEVGNGVGFIGNVGGNRQAVAIPSPPATPPIVKPLKSTTGLKCVQCGETGLRSEDTDCERSSVVQCQESDAVCFSRQILLGSGQNAVEKMCVSWKSVETEYPSAALDSCAESSEGRAKEEQEPVHSIMPKPIEPIQTNKNSQRCSVCVESGMTDPTADCSSSAPAMCSMHEDYCLTKQTQNDDGMKSTFNKFTFTKYLFF